MFPGAAAPESQPEGFVTITKMMASASARLVFRGAGCGRQAQALVLAGPAGYARVFVDHGGPMAHLLGRLAAAHRTGRVELPSSVPPDHLDRLARAFKPDGAYAASRADRDTAGVEALVEPLSDRELEVLGLLAAGKSNQQIADELFVVLDTVKKHVGRILAKLGAANRTQAVARARVLGLLR